MQSPFTWLALIVFIGLAALMLQRSVAATPVDRLWHYAPPAVGCAAVDILGTSGRALLAIAILLAVVAYIIGVLRPGAAVMRDLSPPDGSRGTLSDDMGNPAGREAATMRPASGSSMASPSPFQ